MAGFLDPLFLMYRTVKSGGVALTRRAATNFVGSGVTVADDPSNNQTTVTITAGGSTPSGTGIPHVVDGVEDAAASLIVDADVSEAAAISGAKINPDFGAQDIVSTGLIALGPGSSNAGSNAIAMGNDATAGGDQSIAIGDHCVASSTFAVAIGGTFCTASGAAAVCLGEALTATQPNAVAIGYNCNATGAFAVAIGANCNATAEGTFAFGRNADASRIGSMSHSSGCSNLTGHNAIDLTKVLASTTGNLVASDGTTELAMAGATHVWSMRVRLMGVKTGSNVVAHEVHELLVKSVGGVATIVGDTTVATAPSSGFSSVGWSVTISTSGLIVRFACNSGTDTVTFAARAEWMEVYLV